jgi:Na+/proline symporter
MSSHDVGLSAALAVVMLGLLFYWRLSWYGEEHSGLTFIQKIKTDLLLVFKLRAHAREATRNDTFDTFFLGGKQVGGELTGQTNWSLCFAFANAVWYFAYLGYNYGLWTFVLQVPWTIAIVCLASKLGEYLAATKTGTVHGFIASNYGVATSMLAAIATCIGYVLNCGFEVFYSIHLLAISFDIKPIEIVIAFSLMFFVTGCSAAGGYSANVRTDLWKNLFGSLALVLLILLLLPIYLTKFSSWHDALIKPMFGADYNAMPPWHFVVGIFVFAFFFNFVDMANWQSLAANQSLSAEDQDDVRKKLRSSAYKQIFIPAFLGACLGVMIKAVQSGAADEAYFKIAFGYIFPANTLSFWPGLVLGFIIFGLLSATISSVDNYLLAAMQTLAVDLFRRKHVLQLNLMREGKRQAETEIINWCKRYMPVLGGLMVAVFASLFYLKGESTFAYQFVMYGAAVTLFPVVWAGLCRIPIGADQSPSTPAISHSGAFLSIFVGLLFVLIPFFFSGPLRAWLQGRLGWEMPEDALTNLAPLFGLAAATFVYLLARLKPATLLATWWPRLFSKWKMP